LKQVFILITGYKLKKAFENKPSLWEDIVVKIDKQTTRFNESFDRNFRTCELIDSRTERVFKVFEIHAHGRLS
jgi:hypothetical protein